MLAGLILGATIVIAVLLLVQMLQATGRNKRHLFGFSAGGLLAAAAIVAVVMNSRSVSDSGLTQPAETGFELTEMGRIASGLKGPAKPVQTVSNVASVPSLIDGLVQRLQSNPDDARGWALLAQSYAFLGQADSAEQALRNAVELGLDESDLRSRVVSAERGPHTGLAGVTPAR